MNSDDRRQFGQTAFVNLACNGVRILSSFLTTILASRGLGAAGMGEVSLILGYTMFLCYLLTLGFDNSLTFYVAKFDAACMPSLKRAALRLGVIASAIVGLTTMLACTVLVPFVLHAKGHDEMLWPALLICYHSFFLTQGAVIGGFLRGAKLFMPNIVREQIMFPVGLLLGLAIFVRFLGWGPTGFALAHLVAAFIGFVFIVDRLRRHAPILLPKSEIATQVGRAHHLEWLRFSFPLSVMTALEPTLIWTSVIISGWYLSKADIGVFSVCLRLSIFVQFLSMALVPIFASYLADLFHSKRDAEFRKLYQTVVVWSSKWVLLVTFLIVATSDYVLKVFGPEYTAGTVALALMLPGTAIEGCFGATKQGLVMTGYNRINVINLLIAIATNAIATFFLVQRYGVLGSAAGFSIAFITLNIMRVVQFHHYLKVAPFTMRQFLELLALGTVMTGLGAFVTMRHWAGDVRLTFATIVFIAGLGVSFWNDRDALLGRFFRSAQPNPGPVPTEDG